MDEKRAPCASESGGHESILYVDYVVDELDLAGLVKLILECKGYDVVLKTSGIEALEELRNNPQKFDLLVTNISNPEAQSRKLTAELTKIRPDIPVIEYTENGDPVPGAKAINMGIKTLLQKPFSLSILLRTIRKTLDNIRVQRLRL